MKFRFTIAKKLILGFGIVTLAILANIYLINATLKESIKTNEKISDVYTPSSELIRELSNLMISSKMLIKNWVYIDKKQDTPDKIRLQELHQKRFPEIHKEIKKLSGQWEEDKQKKYNEIYITIQDTLFPLHQKVMNSLSSFESYDDAFVLMFEIYPLAEEDGEIITLSDDIIEILNQLSKQLDNKVVEARMEMTHSFDRLENFILLAGVILVIIAISIALYLSRVIITPIQKIKGILLEMGKGIMPKKQIKESNDEIGEMAGALNNLIRGLKETSEFALEIGKYNFDSPYVPLSDEDDLGNALLDMRTNLKHATEEEEKRKKEDEQRNWASQGVAKFSEILRQNNDDLTKLSYDIISNLVKYCDANQGGLFILNDDDPDNPYIEMSSAYAYNRKKFLEKRIEPGVGLIGRAVQESETIYMTDIPNDYISITSGLGNENPRSLLIVPLKLNEEVFGAIEMASFKPFEKYQIEVVEKIGESIASTYSSAKINIRTAELLEKTQQQAEEMKAQEEEMRQNMEELQATQEESERREAELERKVKEYGDFKKQQEKIIKKLGGNLSGNLISALDEDEDEDEDEDKKKPKKKK
ncbi:MAG TPA: GAF domain-containing protein [Bacteroidales bacterium]|nr:GAF domain-containing protein [Bacteroidales bacterium]